jgi:hypothetical protein
MATKYDSYLLKSTSSITVTTDAPALTLSGIVSDGTNPISYAKVTLSDGTTPATVYTDINGYYSMVVLSTATYSIAVSKTGFGTYTQTGIQVAAGTPETLNVTLTASASTGYMIYGTVLDTQGTPAPIANALVTIANAANEVVQFTQTNANGEYAVYDLAAAAYTVIISKTLYGAKVATVTVSDTVKIAANNQTLVDSPAAVTGSISGTITAAVGSTAIQSAWVGLYRVVGTAEVLEQAVLTGTAGDYIFTNLAAASYFVKSKKIASMS